MGDLTARPRLLFLCQTLPYPPDGGVWIRSYHVLRLLARAFDISALCFERAATFGNGAVRDIAASRDALGRFAAVRLSLVSNCFAVSPVVSLPVRIQPEFVAGLFSHCCTSAVNPAPVH